MASTNAAARPGTRLGHLAGMLPECAAGGAIPRNRLVAPSSSTLVVAPANSTRVFGANQGPTLATGDKFRPQWGQVALECDVAVALGDRLKAAAGGKVAPMVDADTSGDTIKAVAAGGNFGNQPANDGVEIVSDAAGDTTQSITIWYTRDSLGDAVFSETKALNGTTQVVLTHTDVSLVLGALLSAATAGTITIREASGNATITTIAAATLTAGYATVTAADQRAFNVAPTVVAGGASTKQFGLIGTDSAGAVAVDSQALNGTTPVTMNSAFRTVTAVLFGDLATATTATVKVGAEDDENLGVGKALEAGAAGAVVLALVLPK